MREWIVAWFKWMGETVQGFTHNLFVWVRRVAVDYINIFASWKKYANDTIDWWLSWAPWPIDGILSWFGGQVKAGVIDPVFTVIEAPLVYVRNQIDDQWTYDGADYRPALTVALRIRELGGAVLYIHDVLAEYADAAVRVASGLLSDAIATVTDNLAGLATRLSDWAAWLTNFYNIEYDGLSRAVTVARQDLDDARIVLYSFTADPAKWIWDKLAPGLSERVRLWLISIW